MEKSRDIFSQPRFRNGVALVFGENEASLEYRRQSCDIAYPRGGESEFRALLETLREGGATVEHLRRIAPSLESELPEIIEEFDRLGLLTESSFPKPEGVVSGAQLYREVFRMSERVKEKHARSAFYRAMAEGEATRRQLVGYVLEYYHIVTLAPGLVAPALANVESRGTRSILQDFLRSELYHDRMIQASLAAAGIQTSELDLLQPLPTTFSVCASLGVFAKQHPLSFKASLFLFEQSDERFNAAFASRCRQVGLPEGFIEPVLAHAGINDDADHDAVSAALLADVPCVSVEEQAVVKKNVAILVESLLQQEAEILTYYGNPESRVPRIFS